jgi:signal transduction histidine kinase
MGTFIFFIFILYIISAFPGFNPLPRRVLPTELINTYFILFTIIFFTVSYSFLSWLIRLHNSYERELAEQKNQLENVNNNLNRIVYTVSHDLRAPLNSLQGLLELLTHASSEEEKQEIDSLIGKQIVSMKAYIQDVVDYNRNEKANLDVFTITISDLITDVLDSLKGSLDDRIKIELAIPPGTSLDSDPLRLKTILSNLISNAVKYRDFKKSYSEIKIGTHVEENWLCISVSDNGLGIHPKHLSRIFEMFYRATDQREGTGLGLYIVKETISKLGGNISVASELGAGSSFTLRLPHKF